MQSRAFTKLFASITDSSIWGEDDATRIIWITMLAMSDCHGYVGASIPGLAARARKSVSEVEAALERFRSPDPYSRTSEHEGRRIVNVEGGWQLLNWQKYRGVVNVEAARESKRVWAAKARAVADKSRDRLSTVDTNRKSRYSRSASASASPSGSGSDPDLTRARDAQAPTPVEAQGQRLVFRDLDGWEPPESVYEQGAAIGLSRERVDARIDELRGGPIGGQRGTYDRTGYVIKLLPKWRAWDETDAYKRRDKPNQPNAGMTGLEMFDEPGASR